MTPKTKATQLVNNYYNTAKTQSDAIISADQSVFTTICQEIESLHDHVFNKTDYDLELIKSRIKSLYYHQQVAVELAKQLIKITPHT